MQERLDHQADDDLVVGAPTEPDAFLQWASRRPKEEGRYELSRGRVIRMHPGVTRGHARIARNIFSSLSSRLPPEAFDVSIAEFGVRTPFGVRYPDVMVDPVSQRLRELAADEPLFIAEVLSPSTERTDFEDKAEEYTAIATLETYVICSQEDARVWLWSRGADRSWPAQPEEIADPDRRLALKGLGIEIGLADIYRGIRWGVA